MSSTEYEGYGSSSNSSSNSSSTSSSDSTDLDDKTLLEEYQKATLRNVSKEKKKKDWVPDEQYRLLYVYFKDMSLEPLLKSKQEVEVSSKIKKAELHAANYQTLVDRVQSSDITETQKNGVSMVKQLPRKLKTW